jgi:tRNA(fMet)-specific endonuclease VapC
MLDTDTVSYFVRGEGRVAERLLTFPVTAFCISAMTIAEMAYGATHRKAANIQRALTTIVSAMTIAPFDAACAVEFGRLASELMKRGTPIGQMDTLIAAHALTLDVTLVTNNVKHFSRVRGLRVENWF